AFATAGAIATGNKAAAIALTRGNRKLLLVGFFIITLSNWETFWISATAFLPLQRLLRLNFQTGLTVSSLPSNFDAPALYTINSKQR
ncbi:MAG: hypothetical protein CBB81_03925, partial [Cellvibrionales bacterium TMED21]